jgi:hypothetical protein
MNPPDELAAKTGAAAGSDEQLDHQLRAILENLQQVTKEDEPVERDDLRPGIAPYRHGHQYHRGSKQVSFPHCPVARAGRTRRSPNSCACHEPASLTKCGKNIVIACSANGPLRTKR